MPKYARIQQPDLAEANKNTKQYSLTFKTRNKKLNTRLEESQVSL